MNAFCVHGLRQRGVALVTALVVVLALLIIGVSAARTAIIAEKAAYSERDRHIAFQAAEAALADAERDIEGGSDPASARAALFANASSLGFTDGCTASQQSPNLGLCSLAPGSMPAWQGADLAAQPGGADNSVEYGRFTGARMPVGKGPLSARLPRYVIELMPYANAGEDANKRTGNFYRITALGFGSSDATRVVLQSYYLKAAPPEGEP